MGHGGGGETKNGSSHLKVTWLIFFVLFCFFKQAGQCHIHCFKPLCWERGLDDVAVVSQCGAGSRSGEIFRRSSGVQSKLQCLSGTAGPAGHQRCS